VAHCPTRVLRPSAGEFGWLHPLRPVMDYDRGACAFDCTLCTDLCPTKALTPLTPDEKHIFIIGHARVEAANCIGCGLCVENCPKQTIRLKRRPAAEDSGRRSEFIAVVDTGGCIGCGACQHICPATPCKAIIVDGII
ncbi:MAG: 4Fe-4S dicluster domain-containing protein, partial [Muribaculaceae bacterium]|nr:4Fe-4S dicluster domain-containing protein [Muribaculaceae bacterium]